MGCFPIASAIATAEVKLLNFDDTVDTVPTIAGTRLVRFAVTFQDGGLNEVTVDTPSTNNPMEPGFRVKEHTHNHVFEGSPIDNLIFLTAGASIQGRILIGVKDDATNEASFLFFNIASNTPITTPKDSKDADSVHGVFQDIYRIKLASKTQYSNYMALVKVEDRFMIQILHTNSSTGDFVMNNLIYSEVFHQNTEWSVYHEYQSDVLLTFKDNKAFVFDYQMFCINDNF